MDIKDGDKANSMFHVKHASHMFHVKHALDKSKKQDSLHTSDHTLHHRIYSITVTVTIFLFLIIVSLGCVEIHITGNSTPALDMQNQSVPTRTVTISQIESTTPTIVTAPGQEQYRPDIPTQMIPTPVKK